MPFPPRRPRPIAGGGDWRVPTLRLRPANCSTHLVVCHPQLLHDGDLLMGKDTFRVVTRGADGKLRIRDYAKQDAIERMHVQIGVDDCSTDLALRGLPVFQGLIGPMPEGKNVIRYESPEVFETLTKEWSTAKSSRRSRTKPPVQLMDDAAPQS